jgi:serine/threonine protein kinase
MNAACPECAKLVGPNALQGLCPECLMKIGLGSETESGAAVRARGKPFVPPTPAELAPSFPQLDLLELIGQGGMGAVYKARQKELDRIVALKILPPGIGNDPAFSGRFTREAKALARLNHPGIVTLYEFGQANGLFYFLMEFVDGVNLRQLLRSGRVSAREALAIVPQICDALQFAHDQGLVHRDIKPENILLDRRGRVKVADFGLAKLVGTGNEPPPVGAVASSSPGLTESLNIMGTPSYMAPEQAEHPAAVDHRADIYALGVVFYQMLTGELPGKQIEPPSRKVQVDVRLDEIVLRALEKEPARRYQHVSEVGTDVATFSQLKPNPKPETFMKKSILLSLLGAGAVCALFVPASLVFHGKPARTLAIRAFIDGSDVIKVSGDRLWIEHDTGNLPGQAFYVNGRAWTPTWTTNDGCPRGISSEFGGVNPPFLARSGQGIEVANKIGRGTVSFEQFPSADNDQTLAVRVNDEEFGGADWYELVISWDERTKPSVPATKAAQKSD